jgi:hypothetical protein
VEDKVAYFSGEFGQQGGDHVVVLCLLCRDATCAEPQFDGVERVVAVYVAAEDRSAGSAAV